MHQLRVIVFDSSGTREHVFRSSPILLGRLPSNDVQLVDARVSRIHTQLRWTGDTLVVRDMGSGNRTLVVDGISFLELLGRKSLRLAGGRVELLLGDTRVRAQLEHVLMSLVPSEVTAAACVAADDLRNARERHDLATGERDALAHLSVVQLRAMSASVMTVRRSLQTRLAEEPNALRREEDARVALLTWTHQMLCSLSHLENEAQRECELARGPLPGGDDEPSLDAPHGGSGSNNARSACSAAAPTSTVSLAGSSRAAPFARSNRGRAKEGAG